MEKEWLNEPDLKEFNYRGFNCIIKRIYDFGHLCGYVEIPITHPAYGRNDYEDIACYEGITYVKTKDNITTIGFDCAHFMDYVPYRTVHEPCQTYKNMEFVENEIKNIVDQLVDGNNFKD